jgi:hypothetical protein
MLIGRIYSLFFYPSTPSSSHFSLDLKMVKSNTFPANLTLAGGSMSGRLNLRKLQEKAVQMGGIPEISDRLD